MFATAHSTNSKCKSPLIILLLLIALIPSSFIIEVSAADGEEWLTGWDYRKPVDITGSTWGAVTDYQVPIDIYYNVPAYYAFASNGVSQPLNWIDMPQAVYYNGVTYIVWQGGDSTCDPYAISYNHTTDTWSSIVKIGESPLPSDDHGAPALAIDANGYLHVFYGSHSETPGYFSHEKSNNPEDVSAWTAQANIVLQEPTYPNMITNESNIWLFYRSSVTHAPDRVPEAFILSSDNGGSWGASQTIIDHGSGYGTYFGGAELDGTSIYMTWVEFDEGAGNKRFNLYSAYLNTTDSNMYNMSGTNLGITVNKTEADASCIVINSGAYETDTSPLHVDSSGNPHIIYLQETDTAWSFNYVNWTGSEWSANETITTDSDSMWSYADFTIHSLTDIEAYLTTTGEAGVGGDIERWDYNGTWAKNSTIISESLSGQALNAPMFPENYVEDFKLVFSQSKSGDYATTDLKVYAYGDDFIGTQFSLEDEGETDFADVRFTDSDGETELSYWREEYTSGVIGSFWVKVPNIPASPDNATIYVYYGNSTNVATTSNHTATMIRADDGVTGNFDEAVTGTATLTHAGGKYSSTENTVDDSFTSGLILDDWNFYATIREYGIFTDATTNNIQFGLFDVAVVGNQLGTSAAKAPNRRFKTDRRRSSVYTQAQLHYLGYLDTGETELFWDGSAWGGVVSHTQAGVVEEHIWSNGTHLFGDILVDDVSILASPATIAIASVKAFSNGKALMWTEFYTDAYEVNQDIERYFIRKYVDPTPTQTGFGSEESEPNPPDPPSGTDPTITSFVISDLSDNSLFKTLWYRPVMVVDDEDGLSTIGTSYFSFETDYGWHNVSYNYQTDVFAVPEGGGRIIIADGYTESSGTSLTINFYLMLLEPIDVSSNVDVYCRVTDSTTGDSDWSLEQSNYFDILDYVEDIGGTSSTGSTPPEEPQEIWIDSDDDGIPNWDDPDVDGDWVPNEYDPDIDGDGIPNEIDPEPYIPEEEESKSKPVLISFRAPNGRLIEIINPLYYLKPYQKIILPFIFILLALVLISIYSSSEKEKREKGKIIPNISTGGYGKLGELKKRR